MSKLKYLSFLIFLLIESSFCLAEPDSLQIAAIVNKNIITNKDLDDRLRMFLISVPRQPTAEEVELLKTRILKQMIDEKLQIEETSFYNIKAEDAELERQIQHLEKENNLKSGDLLKKLEENNIPHNALLDQLKAGIAWQKLISHLVAASEPSEKDIDQRAKQKQKATGRRYLLAEIALPFTTYFDEVEVEAKAHEIISLMQNKNAFGHLAQQFSQNPSAVRGGDIDWVESSQLPEVFREQIEKTPVGAITQPIKHNQHYYILFVRGKQDPLTTRQKLSVRQIEVSFPLLMSLDQKEEEIKRLEEIMKNVKTCEAFEKIAEELDGATLHFHQNITPQQLSGGLDVILSNLEIGQVSPPLPVEERAVMFFMLCEKHEVDPESDLNEKRKLVRDSLEQKHFAETATKRLISVRRRAFVDIRL